jgi:hypothetical protein
MKIALKYGLLITAVVVAWVVVAHFLLRIEPGSSANLIAPFLFNFVAILATYFGMKARRDQLSGQLSFKEGLKTGMTISVVYALSSCLFFVAEYLVAGPELLMSEAGPQGGPIWKIAAKAFTGLFLGSIFLGLIYSTVISFIVVRQRASLT